MAASAALLRALREHGSTAEYKRRAWDAEGTVDRLDHYRALCGHGGCVNTLRWNRSGSLLASGSDDQTVRLWTAHGDAVETYFTSHAGNVFGAEFVPGSDDRYMITAAADHNVHLLSLDTKSITRVQETGDRVKKLASAEDVRSVVFSAAEDSFIRLHDIRVEKAEELIHLPASGKTLAVSQRRSELLAVGMDKPEVLIYDRRNVAVPLDVLCPADMRSSTSFYVTGVAFAEQSPAVVANYGKNSVYVFDLEAKEQQGFVATLQRTLEAPERELPLSRTREAREQTGKRSEEAGDDEEPGASPWREQLDWLADGKIDKFIAHFTQALTREADPERRAVLLSLRCYGFSRRKQAGDTYAAARDALAAARLADVLPAREAGYALHRLGQALSLLEQNDLARVVYKLLEERYPEERDEPWFTAFREHLEGVEDEEAKKEEKRLAQGRMRRKGEQSSKMTVWSKGRIDYAERYWNHTNEDTDIKEAVFFGPSEEFIVAGSDCGGVFIYDRAKGILRAILKGDSRITNCIAPHPYLPLIATSGIDDEARLFASYRPSEQDEGEGFDEEWTSRRMDEETYVRRPRQMMPQYVFDLLFQNREMLDERPECIQQ